MRGEAKIVPNHLSRRACVYVRQSSVHQVANHRESGRRQRELVRTASGLGWPSSRIVLLDGDTAQSGQSACDREQFKQIVGEVSLGEVGIVMGLEVSRLARNAADWFPLVEMCALTGTLIGDEEGIYDPNDPNDRLILGIKGTLSEAELQMLRARLHGARWSLARRGKLRRKIPTGYVWDDRGRVVKDPDQRVRSALEHFFTRFREVGSACGLARRLHQEGLLFPCRSYQGRWDGPVQWRALSVRTATAMLHNPFYAGAYFYGKQRARTILDPATKTRKTVMESIPMDSWEVLIQETHPAYISWDEFLSNQERIRNNRTMSEGATGSPRNGSALIQGLVYCKRCSRQMKVAYPGGRRNAVYVCGGHTKTGESYYCQSIQSSGVDRWVEQRLFEALEPLGIDAAAAALAELERRSAELKHQWENRIEQAEYEASLARRRYETVDPENRLVASNLERDWEERLRLVEELKKEFEERSVRPPMHISEEDLHKMREMARDLPGLWQAETTKPADRKKIVRILIQGVWVLQRDDPWRTEVILHWRTGALTEVNLKRCLPLPQHVKTPEDVKKRIVQLFGEGQTTKQIVSRLNREGLKTGRGNEFNAAKVRYLLQQWKLRRSHPPHETSVETVERLRELWKQNLPQRKIAEQLNREGHRAGSGKPFNVKSVGHLVQTRCLRNGRRKKRKGA